MCGGHPGCADALSGQYLIQGRRQRVCSLAGHVLTGIKLNESIKGKVIILLRRLNA